MRRRPCQRAWIPALSPTSPGLPRSLAQGCRHAPPTALAPALSPCSLPGHTAGCKDVWISLCCGKSNCSLLLARSNGPPSGGIPVKKCGVWGLGPVTVPVECCLMARSWLCPWRPQAPNPQAGAPNSPGPPPGNGRSPDLQAAYFPSHRAGAWSSRRGPGVLRRKGLPAGGTQCPGLPPQQASPKELVHGVPIWGAKARPC